MLIIFVAEIALLGSMAKAATLEITSKSNIASPENILNFSINFDDSNTYKIKPVVSLGGVQILNGPNWISGSKLWGEMPFLSKNIKLKLLSSENRKTELSFLIQDIKRGKIYQTSEAEIWPNSLISGYIQKVNQSIGNWNNDVKMTQ